MSPDLALLETAINDPSALGRALGCDVTMRWACTRGCGASGEKRYQSTERAAHYAQALNREDRDDLGRRPLLSLLPLGLARRARRDDGGSG